LPYRLPRGGPAWAAISPQTGGSTAAGAVAAGELRMGLLKFAAALLLLAQSGVPASDWRPVVTGQLANGVRFAILPRHGSEPGLGLVIRNEGGFIAEQRPGERGLAHLIEHLFFVSPTGKAPADVGRLMRIGVPLTFPAPTAGSTSWRETNYFLSTRTTAAADLDTLLGLFREASSDLAFRPDLVDAQRADVMREMAGRKPGNLLYADYVAAVAPGSPNDLLDAQNSDDVPLASIDTIRSLYRRLYRPENMMIVVVGDIEPAQVQALVAKHFASWKASGPAPARAALPAFRPGSVQPISFATSAQGRRTALVTVAMPVPAPPRSRDAQMDAMLMDMLASRAVSDRLAAAQPASPRGKTGMFIENGAEGYRQILLWDNFEPGAWGQAVAGLNNAVCELAGQGLSVEAWEAAKRAVIGDLEQRSAGMAAAQNVELAKDLSHALAAGTTLIPPDALLQHARARFPSVDAPAANRWWREQWRAGAVHVRVEAPELARAPNALAAIRAAADDAVASPGCKVRR
jgi:hypothetical protein